MSGLKLLLIGAISNSEATYGDGVRKRFGGSVMYAARTAAALGIDTTVITIGADDIEGGVKELNDMGIKTYRIKRAGSNNFSNDYSSVPRKMFLSSFVEKPISARELNLDLGDFSSVLLLPTFNEIDWTILSNFPTQTILLDPQGLMTLLGRKNETGLYPKIPSDWSDMEKYLGRINILKLSDEDMVAMSFPEDLKTDQDKGEFLAKRGFPIVIVTRGARSTIVVDKNGATTVDSYKKDRVDTAGAGDVFGAAFIFQYEQTQDAREATKFANAAAALKISGEKCDIESIYQTVRQGS